MTITAFGTIFAVIALSFATYISILHYTLLSMRIKNKIGKTDHRIPSGIGLVTAPLAVLAWSVGGQSEVICYWALGIIVFDPMNWVILAVVLREGLGKMKKWL